MYIGRSKKFDKQYCKLSLKHQEQFAARLKQYVENQHDPLLRVHALGGEYRGNESFNVNADIRAIFSRDKDKTLLVAIGSHSQLYG